MGKFGKELIGGQRQAAQHAVGKVCVEAAEQGAFG
jgi:hypothetical protein